MPREPKALELERPATGQHREDHLEVGPAQRARVDPREVCGLHPGRVVGQRGPPPRFRRRGSTAVGMNEEEAALLCQRIEDVPEHLRLNEL